jgi:LCP family protein required for cell wall assembly
MFIHSGKMLGIAASVVALGIFALAVITFTRQPNGDYFVRRVTTRLTVGDAPLNLLVIANNARSVPANQPLGLGTAAGQADVILVLHVDPMQRGIWAITIPRDTLVAQPHWHNPIPKIKTLFFMGNQETPQTGPQETAHAVSRLTGLPINGYLVANFAGFQDAVDFLGGIDVNVRRRLYDPQNSHADFQPGLQHMNGAQALAFVRIRQNQAGNDYRVNDFQRMNAEVQVLSLIRAKLFDPKHAALLFTRFVARMQPDIATNLSQEQLLRVGLAMVGVPITEVSLDTIDDSMQLASARIPGVNADGIITGASYDVLDPEDVCRRLQRFGARNCTTGIPSRSLRDISIHVHGTQRLAARLRTLGFRHVTIVGAPTGEARIVYTGENAWGAWTAARAIGGGAVTVEPGMSAEVEIIAYE